VHRELVRLVSIGVCGAVLTCGVACVRRPAPAALRRGETARAIVGRRAARFTFPPETADRMMWPGYVPNAYEGMPLRTWIVEWEHGMPEERFGVDPDGIWLGLRWRVGETREWLLRDLLARLPLEIATFCRPCGTPAVTTRPDQGARVVFEGANVVFAIAGEAAVRRIFPAVPDSVTFTRVDGSGGEQSVTVAIERREP